VCRIDLTVFHRHILYVPNVSLVVSRPRFGYDTHARRMRDVRATVSETQAEAFCIYMYEAGPPGLPDR
jgi:hypothetical protein